MPFSWKKKTRCTRFSQLVADHLQSPKRGGSLVVETGFPTSLIDLYVRNRGRFRKCSEKKRRGNDSSTPLSSSSDSLVNSNNLSSVASDYRGSDEIIEEDVGGGGVVGSVSEIESANSSKIEEERSAEMAKSNNSSKIEEERSVEMAKSNRVLMVALKVLFMVVLALGTKRFTVGITVSALLLFFLELVGKPLLGRSSLVRPGVDRKALFESSFHRAKNIESSKENTTPVVCNEVLEIEEVVDSKLEIRSEKELDEVRCEVLMEIKHKSSCRAKMKSKMKKLVPKKLRPSKKSSMDPKGEMSRGFKEEDTMEPDQDLKPLVYSSKSSDLKGENLCVSKQEQTIVQLGQSSSLTLSTEIGGNDKELGRESQENSGYLVLCLIVLIGLVGGRILALVLALSWCLMLKMTQRRLVKFPIS